MAGAYGKGAGMELCGIASIFLTGVLYDLENVSSSFEERHFLCSSLNFKSNSQKAHFEMDTLHCSLIALQRVAVGSLLRYMRQS